jgi:hypothetical protein
MGSLLTSFLESMGSRVRPDGHDLMLTEDVYDAGLANAVKTNDDLFPPEFRLSKSGRQSQEPETDHDQAGDEQAGR